MSHFIALSSVPSNVGSYVRANKTTTYFRTIDDARAYAVQVNKDEGYVGFYFDNGGQKGVSGWVVMTDCDADIAAFQAKREAARYSR